MVNLLNPTACQLIKDDKRCLVQILRMETLRSKYNVEEASMNDLFCWYPKKTDKIWKLADVVEIALFTPLM